MSRQNEHPRLAATLDGATASADYESPALTRLGDLAELTLAPKTVGAADGSSFQGLDIGSI